MSFEAFYDGACAAECGSPIKRGEVIESAAVPTRASRYRHVRCPQSNLEVGPREKICPDCHLVRPCEC